MRRALIAMFSFTACLALGAGVAQAVVVDVQRDRPELRPAAGGPSGAPYVTYPTDQANYIGVAHGAREREARWPPTTCPTYLPRLVQGSGARAAICSPDTGICYHGGPVMHANETFALTWDPLRRYWAQTRGYVEQFLSNVAGASNTLTSPYAVATQYTDSTGRAEQRLEVRWRLH